MSKFYFDGENDRNFELPGARPHYNPDRPGQVEHIFLDLDLDIPNQRYRGICRTRINPVRSGIDRLTLDAVNLAIESVKVAGTDQAFDYDGEQLFVKLNPASEAGKSIDW